jgi:predicted porin
MDRKLIAVAVSTALGLPMAADAVEFSTSGHINRAVLLVNQDGNANDGVAQHVDNNSSQSRFKFTGSGDLDNGLTAGVHLEYGLNTNVRHANLSLSSAGGKLTVGHGSVASDGATNARLGGPSWLAGVTNWCSYVSQGSGCLTHDGGRSPSLRYDTPAIGPLSIAASTGNDEYWDAKATIAGSVGDSGYDLRVGYVGDNGAGEDVLSLSAAVKFPTGTAIAASWGQNEDEGTESQHIEVDHSYGAGSVGIAYRQGEDNGVEGSTWAVGIGHGLGNGATAFAGYRFIEGDDIEDVSAFFAGMRVTFN